MTTTDRTVHHLHLRAPNAHAARQAVHRLEDALRCASLPDAGERVLLVRQLHLGPLPKGLSSQSLSLLIEQRVAAVGGAWVHGDDDARAARSDAVFFPNRLHAAKAALRRRALGERLDAWHWPLALPGVDVHAGPTEFLSQLLHSVQQWPEAPVAMAALADHGQPEVQAWWAAHAPPAWRDHPRARVPRAQPRQPTPHEAVAQAPAGPRAATAHRGADTPAAGHAPADPNLSRPDAHAAPRPAASTVPTPTLAGPLSAGLAVDRGGPLNGAARAVEHQDVGRAGERDTVRTPQSLVQPPPAELAFAMAAARAKAEGAAIAAAHAPVPMDAFARHAALTSESGALLETRAGGLLFLWPLLQRVGFAEWDAAHPDAWMAPQVLRRALQRLRVPPDDPAWALLASLHAPPGPGTEPDGELWLRRCRQHARRRLQIGLASLVVRPAWLHWSETHIDLHFRPGDADLRVRRAGLDTDPGWVDALQRVVGFHFDREDH